MDELARYTVRLLPWSCLVGGSDNMLPGRQGRLLFAYLALSRLQPVSRSALIDALWGDDQPADAGGALRALISKTRGVVGGDVLRGLTELTLTLPEPAHVDVEVALSMLHTADPPSLWVPGDEPGLPL